MFRYIHFLYESLCNSLKSLKFCCGLSLGVDRPRTARGRYVFSVLLGVVMGISVAGGPVWAGSAGMTLADCLDIGLKNNPALKAAVHNVAAGELDIKAARADFFPFVTSSFTITDLRSINSKGMSQDDYLDQEKRAFNIRMVQVLYAGARILNTYKRAGMLKRIAQAELRLEQMEVAYRIETSFYTLMKYKQDVIIAREAVNRLVESVKSAEAFFKRELIRYADVLRAQLELTDARDTLVVAENNVNRGRAQLFALMNMTVDPEIGFTGDPDQRRSEQNTHDSCLRMAMANRPDIKNLYDQIEMAGKDAKIAMGQYLPKVELDVGYYDVDTDYDDPGRYANGRTYSKDQRNRYWSAGITARWNFFDGGKAWYQKGKHQAQIRRLTALVQDAKNMLSTNIHNALYAMRDAEQRIESAKAAASEAREYYASEKHLLKAGLSTVPDLLYAQDRLIQAEGRRNRSILDYRLAVSELKLFTGGATFDGDH